MCDREAFETATANGGLYYSPTFAQDRFIHATADPKFLLEAGNHFYKEVRGEWICVKLEVTQLPPNAVIYEAPAPVGRIEAVDYSKDAEVKEAITFPHIYSGIPAKAVIGRHRIIRGDDGSFLSIEGLC